MWERLQTIAVMLDHVKLLDVAKAAGVSVSTVSRVVNGDENVRASTRERVEKVMERLRYHPNLHARSLVEGSSRILGVIVSNLDNPFFLDVYRRLETLAYANGFETLLLASHYDAARLREGIRSLIGQRVAGIAAIVSEMQDDVLDELDGTGIPVVCYDFTSQRGLTNIRSNYGKGMRQLVEYLYSLGHRRMALVAYRIALGSTEDRRRAFLETMASHKAPAHVFSPAADGPQGGREAVAELLESGFDATAIICINDVTAVGVLKELAERRIAVPRELSVAGFDNIQLGQYTIPSLTTVNVPRDRIAELAFEALRKHARGDMERGREFVLEPDLIVRGSTGICARKG